MPVVPRLAALLVAIAAGCAVDPAANGDGVCGDVTCPAGFVCTDGHCETVCGDGACVAPYEDCDACRADCAPCPGTCGDGACEWFEDCAGCPADCACGDGAECIDAACEPVTCGEEACGEAEASCADCPR